MSNMQPKVMLPKISLNSLVSMASSNNSLAEIKIELVDSEAGLDSDNDMDMVEIGPEMIQVQNSTSQSAKTKNKNKNGKNLSNHKQKCLQKYEAAKRELLSMLESNADTGDEDEETSETHNGSTERKSHPPNKDNQKCDTQTDNSTLAKVLNNQQTMLQMLKALTLNQKKLTQEVSSLSVKLDETYLKLLLRENNDASGVFNENTFKLKRLETHEDLEEFESKMSDENVKRKVMNQLTYLCSASIDGGATCFYRLIDVLFTRQLLNECSWSGGSRGHNDKMAFRRLKSTIDFIFQMVNFWDPNFTLENTEMLLKIVLRNAKKRMEAKFMRASTSRKRRKRIEIAQIDIPTDVDSEYEDNMHTKSQRKLEKNKDRIAHAVKLETRKRRRNTEETDDNTNDEYTYALKLPIKIRKQNNHQGKEDSDSDIETETTNKTQNKQQKKQQANEDSASETEIEITKSHSKMLKKNVNVRNKDHTAESSAKVSKNTPEIKQQVNEESEIEIDIETAETPRKRQNKSNQDTDNEQDCMDYEQEDTAINFDSDNSENSDKSPEDNIRNINHEIRKDTCSTNLFGMKPIENLKDFEEFEALISNNTQKQKLMNQCSFLCTPTIGKGVTFAYKLVDELFSRHFLKECSWSGGTRNVNEGRKIPFKTFKNTLLFFFLMVNFWDSEYSMENNEIFLKAILRNAKKRAGLKQMRGHHQKNRFCRKKSKNINYHNGGDGDTSNDDIVHIDSAAISGDAEGTIDVLETAENICELFNNTVSESLPNSDKSVEKSDETLESVKLNLLNIKPIRSLQELEEFEREISNREVEQELMDKYSVRCPKSKGNGTAFAYNLLDSMFSRDFLCHCSWLGGSKSGEIKVPIKRYKNMLKFFFQLVHYWDSNYTFEDLETFFKVVLKKCKYRLLQEPPAPSINIRVGDGLYEATTMDNKDKERTTEQRRFRPYLCSVNNTKGFGIFEMNPIKTVEELQKFEKLLTDNNKKTSIMNQLSILFPISLGKGITCAYRLIDRLFSRQFFCECSWSGGSRGEELKICFKSYKNTINFVYEMVSFWDPSYTESENKVFLQLLLRNAKKRAAAKNMRISTQRRRMRKQKNLLSGGIDPLCLTLNDESANEETAENFLRLFKDTLQSACDDDDD